MRCDRNTASLDRYPALHLARAVYDSADHSQRRNRNSVQSMSRASDDMTSDDNLTWPCDDVMTNPLGSGNNDPITTARSSQRSCGPPAACRPCAGGEIPPSPKTKVQGRSQGEGGRGARPSLGVFRRPPDGIRAPVGRRPTLGKITSEASEVHGNPKNHVRTIRAI